MSPTKTSARSSCEAWRRPCTSTESWPTAGSPIRILDPSARLDRLEQKLRGLDFELSGTVPIIASLLSLPLLDRYRPPALSAPQLRRQTLGVVVSWLIREAEHKHRPASAPARWASDSRLALSRPSCCE